MPAQQKLIVVMGATGTGKSRLSLDLAARFPPSTFEIINADKMQLYKGLDVTTNKLAPSELRLVPHHLLGEFDSRHGEVSPAEFRSLASKAISGILSRGKVPVLVGGSNSFIYALLVERFDPDVDVFDGEVTAEKELRYNCCFLWVDVAFPVLTAYLSQRLEEMLGSGMFHELAEFQGGKPSAVQTGVGKSIGVAEFRRYFEKYAAAEVAKEEGDDPVRRGAYDKAVGDVKHNTWQLAKRQIGKIGKLRKAGWDIKRLDATAALRAVVTSDDEEEGGGKGWSEIWENEVVEASVKIVSSFLEE